LCQQKISPVSDGTKLDCVYQCTTTWDYLARFFDDSSGGRSLLLVVTALVVVLFIVNIHGAGRIGMIMMMMMIIMWYQHFHKPLAPIDYFGQARFVVQFDKRLPTPRQGPGATPQRRGQESS
jgi:hypothetical protein